MRVQGREGVKVSNDMVIVSKSEIEAIFYPYDTYLVRQLQELLNKAQVVNGEPITNLYRTSNGSLKISQVYPPEAKSFPVFAHPTSMREVARLVINDNVELIMSHGGLPLWKALVENINSIYTEAVAFREAPQPAIPEGFAVADPNLSDEKTIEIYKDVISHKDREIKELITMLEAAKKEG